jgi:hypothetical protein
MALTRPIETTSSERCFRFLIGSIVAFHVLWAIIPWSATYSVESYSSLAFVRFDPIVSPEVFNALGFLSFSIALAVYTGLFFFQRWARLGLLLVLAFGGMLIFIQGISIHSAAQATFGYFLTLLEGSCLAVCYLSRISEKFGK